MEISEEEKVKIIRDRICAKADGETFSPTRLAEYLYRLELKVDELESEKQDKEYGTE